LKGPASLFHAPVEKAAPVNQTLITCSEVAVLASISLAQVAFRVEILLGSADPHPFQVGAAIQDEAENKDHTRHIIAARLPVPH
jgi:hypothetical protein